MNSGWFKPSKGVGSSRGKGDIIFSPAFDYRAPPCINVNRLTETTTTTTTPQHRNTSLISAPVCPAGCSCFPFTLLWYLFADLPTTLETSSFYLHCIYVVQGETTALPAFRRIDPSSSQSVLCCAALVSTYRRCHCHLLVLFVLLTYRSHGSYSKEGEKSKVHNAPAVNKL
ncbi:hypothetical protein ASPBRDRAFT_493893 [Aspergillus brasiliensis CBS 101740]|uniref:Uncharacterized protein n=1 Tax=Aspergillus brasiliensis (strain CBS 101740 / IMI 381727 / IBT 21946) TaxID=767769 RepID=A0A1L9UN83_ASPBC|nr:hypothetical protein ASPBRDRAFT_493893 [Aspergillus brasiliensis CBS 101740]